MENEGRMEGGRDGVRGDGDREEWRTREEWREGGMEYGRRR